MPRIAVIGLGRYGMELAKCLAEGGVEVLAIDSDSQLVEQAESHVTVAVTLDSTDPDALASQRISGVDVAVVAIGEGFEATLLTVLGLKQLGVRRVVARARNVTRGAILEKIGADQVVLPELDNARRLARALISPRIEDYLDLDADHCLVQMQAPKRFHNKTLADLNLRHRHGVNVVAIRRSRPEADGAPGPRVIRVPRPDDTIRPDDILVIIGSHEALAGLPAE